MRILFLSISVFLICACKSGTDVDTPTNTEKPFYLYKYFEPSNQDLFENEKYPLLLFLHGAGERGTDLDMLDVHGPPKLAKADASFPFGVLSPLCPTDAWWDAAKILALLDYVIDQNPNIDTDRIYLTGLSMGGYGSWDVAYLAPNRFAAMVTICGGSLEHAFRVNEIKHIPTWVFHGAKDDVVPLENSQNIVDALKNVGSDVKFTIYPDAGHDSWTETYNNPELYAWMLQHSIE